MVPQAGTDWEFSTKMSKEIILLIAPTQKRIRKFIKEFWKLLAPEPIFNEPAKTADEFQTYLMVLERYELQVTNDLNQLITANNFRLYEEAFIFKAAFMYLRNFSSNGLEVMSKIPKSDQETKVDLWGSSGKTEKNDTLIIQLKAFEGSTKRELANFTASHFDLLSLVSPIFLPWKVFW